MTNNLFIKVLDKHVNLKMDHIYHLFSKFII